MGKPRSFHGLCGCGAGQSQAGARTGLYAVQVPGGPSPWFAYERAFHTGSGKERRSLRARTWGWQRERRRLRCAECGLACFSSAQSRERCLGACCTAECLLRRCDTSACVWWRRSGHILFRGEDTIPHVDPGMRSRQSPMSICLVHYLHLRLQEHRRLATVTPRVPLHLLCIRSAG